MKVKWSFKKESAEEGNLKIPEEIYKYWVKYTVFKYGSLLLGKHLTHWISIIRKE